MLGLIVLAVGVHAQQLTRLVVGITDGDTLTVLSGHHQVKVRLSAVDAPEKAQPFGNRSQQGLASLCFGRIADVNVSGRDRYGRAVGDVYCDGRSANESQVSQGLAWVYRQYAPGNSPLYELEAEARASHRGLWTDAEPTAPWEWRKVRRQARQSPPVTP